jgi:chemotaxis protein CheX
MDTDDGPGHYRLPPALDARAAAPLAQELRARAGSDLTLIAEDVQRLGAQCLQVLLAAQRKWAADGCRLHVRRGSEPFTWAASLMGAACILPLAEEEFV